LSNLLTDWREAIQALLATAFPTAEVDGEIYPGEFATISRDKDRIRVFTNPLEPDSRNVNDARPRLTVHYFLSKAKFGPLTAEVPQDPADIEQVMATLAATFKAHLTSVGGMDYYHVESITPDRELYAVEVLLTAWTRNPAEAGG
jgi:hypothetical protein